MCQSRALVADSVAPCARPPPRTRHGSLVLEQLPQEAVSVAALVVGRHRSAVQNGVGADVVCGVCFPGDARDPVSIFQPEGQSRRFWARLAFTGTSRRRVGSSGSARTDSAALTKATEPSARCRA